MVSVEILEQYKRMISQEAARYSNLIKYTTHYTEEGLSDLKALESQIQEVIDGKRERLEGFDSLGKAFHFVSRERSRAKKMTQSKSYEVHAHVRPLLDEDLKFWDDFYNLFLFEDEKEI